MKCKCTALIILAIAFGQQLFAHALWIETNPAGTKGKAQEVKVFFGEFADKDISPAATWFSDLKDFSLVVITPDKKEIKLSSIAKTDHYLATFTPTEDGVYTVVLHHAVKDVYHTMKLDYNSSATIAVGNTFTGNNIEANTNAISLFSDSAFAVKKNTATNIKAWYNNKLAARQEVKIFAPNGWEKTLHTNADGQVSITPLWPGKYMAEATHIDKIAGEHNGVKFEQVYVIATYIITVK